MFRVLPESERIASFKAGRYRGVQGPGIVFCPPFGGERVRLRIGQAVTPASEGEVLVGRHRVPARIEGPAGGRLRIVRFDEASVPPRPVVAQSEPDASPRQAPSRPATSTAGPRPTGTRFWLGLAVVLGFAAVSLGGGLWAADRVWLQHSLDERGEVAPGEILRKEQIGGGPGNPRHTVFEISYRFRVDGRSFRGTERTERTRFFHADRGDAIRIRYLPDDPARNRPEGYGLTLSDWLGAGLGLGAGAFFLVVSAGMILARRRGGEASGHP